MGTEYAIMCKLHKEAIIIAKYGKVLFINKNPKEIYPFNYQKEDEYNIEELSKLDNVNVNDIIKSFIRRHPNCSLTLGTDKNSSDWPWGEFWKHPDWRNKDGSMSHPSGWILFHIYECDNLIETINNKSYEV